MGLYVSTTGTDVAIPELGIVITHPATNMALSDQFSPEDLQNAETLTSVIRAGTLVWRKTAGGAAQTATDYDSDFVKIEQQNTGLGSKQDRSVTFDDITNGAEDVSFSNVTVGNVLSFEEEVSPPTFTTTSTNGTLTLAAGSRMCQFLSGSAVGFSVTLPPANALSVGWKYEIYNVSTKTVTLKDGAGTAIFQIATGSWTFVRLQVNDSVAGTWFVYQIWGGGSGGSGVTPPFVFSKSGGLSVGSYLYTGQAVSNKTGQEIAGENKIVKIGVSNAVNATADTVIQFQRRTSRTAFSDIAGATITVPTGSFRALTILSPLDIGPDWELSCYNKSGGSLQDPVVVLYLVPA